MSTPVKSPSHRVRLSNAHNALDRTRIAAHGVYADTTRVARPVCQRTAHKKHDARCVIRHAREKQCALTAVSSWRARRVIIHTGACQARAPRRTRTHITHTGATGTYDARVTGVRVVRTLRTIPLIGPNGPRPTKAAAKAERATLQATKTGHGPRLAPRWPPTGHGPPLGHLPTTRAGQSHHGPQNVTAR